MKRTNLITFDNGKAYRVYKDVDNRLFYKAHGTLFGTYIEYCVEGTPDKVK